MKKINYKFSDGTIKAIEVTDEFAAAYEEINKEYRQAEERYKWFARKHITSLDSILDAGGQIEDEISNFAENDYKYEELHNAIAELSPEQRWLVEELYFNGRTNCSVADELGLSETAVRHRLVSIFKKLKSILDENVRICPPKLLIGEGQKLQYTKRSGHHE